MTAHIVPRTGERRRILACRDPVLNELRGRTLIIDAVLRSGNPHYPFLPVIGRIEGDENLASLDFTSGVKLGKPLHARA